MKSLFTRDLEVVNVGLSSFADNITAAVRAVRPAAVDVSSGVEASKGIKDAARMAAFIAGVHHASV